MQAAVQPSAGPRSAAVAARRPWIGTSGDCCSRRRSSDCASQADDIQRVLEDEIDARRGPAGRRHLRTSAPARVHDAQQRLEHGELQVVPDQRPRPWVQSAAQGRFRVPWPGERRSPVAARPVRTRSRAGCSWRCRMCAPAAVRLRPASSRAVRRSPRGESAAHVRAAPRCARCRPRDGMWSWISDAVTPSEAPLTQALACRRSSGRGSTRSSRLRHRAEPIGSCVARVDGSKLSSFVATERIHHEGFVPLSRPLRGTARRSCRREHAEPVGHPSNRRGDRACGADSFGAAERR